ncbi:MAG: acetyl-CoA hydrolase/transferase C-terminal domain-containing protein, partial [Candidatus Deferrimicrobiaceae bacterium]
ADGESRFALLLLDLNRFKNINDSLGHAFGDRLLKLIGERFLAACPDTATLGRFGGDEFVVLLPRVQSSADAEGVAARLLSETEKPLELEGMHDVYEPDLPPNVKPLMIQRPSDRIGIPYLTCPTEKIKAIVETNHPDRTTTFKEPDADSKAISKHILDFFRHEVKKGRLPKNLLPLQSGVGNVANAVLYGLLDSEFEDLTVYTEVIQDGMLALIDAGKITFASSTAFSVSPPVVEKFKKNIDQYKDKIILRPQSISNHVGIIKRLGVLAMNGCVEFDLHGNVNSTHINGTRIINGIGGSGDFARNSFISIFTTPSVAARGDISCVVPMVSHVDHCEHDVDVVVTEQGLADLRGTSPKQRAVQIIDKCVHPDYRPMLKDYYFRALNHSPGKHTP